MNDICTDRDVREAAALLWTGERTDALDEPIARAAWTTIAEPSDVIAGRLTQALGAAPALRVAVRGDAATAVERAGIEPRAWQQALERWRPRLSPRLTAEALRGAHRHRLTLVAPTGEAWPNRLDDLGAHAPVALWVRGDPAALRPPRGAIAIVGARASSGYGEQIAAELAGDLALDGVTVVSGGAYGIDGSAHRAAVREGGVSVAVMAGGADRVYPAGHAHLLQRLVETGAVVSEVAPGGAPTKFRFLRRNRLIAALGDATIVVEAAARSGSLSTAGAAAELGRPLGAVPGSVLASTSAGCHRLLREYDAVCVTCADDVRELAGLGRPIAPSQDRVALAAPADELTLRIRDALAFRRWRTVEEVATLSGVAFAETTAVLGLLALDGTAETQEDRWRLAT